MKNVDRKQLRLAYDDMRIVTKRIRISNSTASDVLQMSRHRADDRMYQVWRYTFFDAARSRRNSKK